MAEELGWEIDDLDSAFAEVAAQGMAKADFKARLVWLPNGLKHNKPESPNVVRSWRAELDLLPECDLKREALKGLRAKLADYGVPYVEAFDEVVPSRYADICETPLPNTHGKPSGKASGNAGEAIPEGIPEGMPESGAGAGTGIDDDDPGAGARTGTHASAPACEGDPLDDPAVPQKRSEWKALFAERYHELDISSERALDCMKGWKKAGVTAGQMRQAILRAEERSAGPVGCWSAYVDTVLNDQREAAAQAAAKASVPRAEHGPPRSAAPPMCPSPDDRQTQEYLRQQALAPDEKERGQAKAKAIRQQRGLGKPSQPGGAQA
jgi:hypothetical protein